VGSVTGIRRDALIVFFFQAEDGIRDSSVTGVQTCALPIYPSIDPIVDENMLADPRDIARMRDAVKRLAVITQQPALQGIADWIRSEERRVGKECRSRVGGLPGKDNGQKRIADQQARNWTHV